MNKKDLDVHLREEKGDSNDMMEAVTNERIESLTTMVEHGNDLYFEDESGNTLVHMAAKAHKVASLQFLLSRGLDVNKQNSNGQTPMHFLVVKEETGDKFELLQTCEFMVEKGADAFIKDKLGDSAVTKAQRLM